MHVCTHACTHTHTHTHTTVPVGAIVGIVFGIIGALIGICVPLCIWLCIFCCAAQAANRPQQPIVFTRKFMHYSQDSICMHVHTNMVIQSRFVYYRCYRPRTIDVYVSTYGYVTVLVWVVTRGGVGVLLWRSLALWTMNWFVQKLGYTRHGI